LHEELMVVLPLSLQALGVVREPLSADKVCECTTPGDQKNVVKS